VYKLEEIDRRIDLFEKGQRVLDLGASPGSWTLYAARRVGPGGYVLGVDLHDPEVTLPAQAEFRVLDAFSVEPDELGGRFDVVISDMAPKTSGQRHADQYRSYELFVRALEVANAVLQPGGKFVGKIFQGAEFDQARNQAREVFEKVRVIRPKATRDESYELFLVGLGRRSIT
jgi:23S rRNA (uridine2552-2'-O)-methyltransferase